MLHVEPATTLLEALRTHLNLTGTKEACDRGACGACSVLIDGKLMNACMTLAVNARGQRHHDRRGPSERRRAASGSGGVHQA